MQDPYERLVKASEQQQAGQQRWRQGDLRGALALYDQAAALLDGINDPMAGPLLASIWQNKAAVLLDLNDATSAAALLDRAIAIFRPLVTRQGRSDLAPILAVTYQTKATAFRALGDAESALALQDEVIALWDRLVQQEGRADYRSELAKIYSNKANALEDLGRFRASVEHYDKAIDVRRQLIEKEGKQDLRGDLAKARVYRAGVLLKLGEHGRAATEMREAAALLKAEAARTGRADLRSALEWVLANHQALLTGPTPRPGGSPGKAAEPADVERQLKALDDQMNAFYQQGNLAKAIEVALRASALARQHLGVQSAAFFLAHSQLGQLHVTRGELDRAEAVCFEVLEVARKLGDATDPNVALAKNNLAEVYRQTGRHAKAAPLYREALPVLRKQLGDRHAHVAVLLNNLALSHLGLGEPDKAEPLFQQSLDIRREVYGEHHPSYATCLANLADVSIARHDYPAAQELILKASAICLSKLGKDHPISALLIDKMAGIAELRARAEQASERAAAVAPGKQLPRTSVAEELDALNRQVVALTQQGRWQEVTPLAERAVELARGHFGADHAEFARTLNNLALMRLNQGDANSTRPLLEQVLAIWRRSLPKDHPDLAIALTNLGEIHRQQGEVAAAVVLFEEALEVRKRAFGEEHYHVGQSLYNLAAVHQLLGHHAEAEPLARRGLEQLREAVGENHPELLNGLRLLADVYQELGRPAEALPLLQRAVPAAREIVGEGHPDFVGALRGLALLYHELGEAADAVQAFRQVVDLTAKVHGTDHDYYPAALHNLAAALGALGNHAEALPLLKKSLVIEAARQGEDSAAYAQVLCSLGGTLENLGDYPAAEAHYRRALSILAGKGPEQRWVHAVTLNNLGNLYRRLGDYRQAVPLLQESLELYAQAPDEDALNHGLCLQNLGVAYQEAGRVEQALPVYRAALDVLKGHCGDNHPAVAQVLKNLGNALAHRGDAAGAEDFLAAALSAQKRLLGDKHPSVVSTQFSLGLLWAAGGRPEEADTLLRQALGAEDGYLFQTLSASDEGQRLTFVATLREHLDAYLSLVLAHFPTSPGRVGRCLDVVLRRKALAAEAAAVFRQVLLEGRYQHLKGSLRELSELRMRICQAVLSGVTGRGEQVERWQTRARELEGELVRQVPEMNLEQKVRDSDRRAVALALPEGAVLVEFVRFMPLDFSAVPPRAGDDHYAAFVLPAGEPDRVQLVDLGQAGPMDRLIADFRASVTGEAESRAARNMVRRPEAAAAPDGDAGQRLREALLDPLAAAVGGCRRLFLAPDGDLARLPFEALPAADGRRVIDTYRVCYLGCGRDVLRWHAAPAGRLTAPVVIADPDFDLRAGAAASPAGPPATARGRASRDFDPAAWSFDRLPGTRAEGERVARLLGVQPWLEGQALEQRLKGCHSPSVLHLATHGFFLADQERPPAEMGGVRGDAGRRLENPLLRSGLALAGANGRSKGFTPPVEAEDGLLTAEDVTGIDLLGTELVVLSACETGLGEIHAGEGVFGLRRAFVLSGARTLIMSLWKVPDQQTGELMEDFYRRILAGEGRADALRGAQLALRQRHPDPYFWGAFICQGDPAPLSGEAPGQTEATQRVKARWFYSADGKKGHGPVSDAELKELVRSGRLSRAGKISLDGKNWHSASSLKGVNWPTA